MTAKIKVKTFVRALFTIGTNPKKAKLYLNDKRLTQAEKIVLSCFFYLRDNNFELVIKSLTNLVTSDIIVESQRNLLLGIAYNNQTNFLSALSFLERAAELMQNQGISSLEFMAYNNLFIVHRNLKNVPAMKLVLQKMYDLGIEGELIQMTLLLLDFKLSSVSADYAKADEVLLKLEPLKHQMNEGQIISYLVDKFDFYVKTERFNQCQNALTEMKSYRKFQLTANYNFMKLLLNHYTDDKPLYITDSDFKGFPLLYNQIKLIQALEEVNMQNSNLYWSKLANHNSLIYGIRFGDYKGDICLFSICLNKHQRLDNVYDLKKVELPESKEKALVKLLTEADGPIHQETIYELLWEEVAKEKSDLNKLARLVYVVNSKTGLEIKMKKSCYFLVRDSSSIKIKQLIKRKS